MLKGLGHSFVFLFYLFNFFIQFINLCLEACDFLIYKGDSFVGKGDKGAAFVYDFEFAFEWDSTLFENDVGFHLRGLYKVELELGRVDFFYIDFVATVFPDGVDAAGFFVVLLIDEGIERVVHERVDDVNFLLPVTLAPETAFYLHGFRGIPAEHAVVQNEGIAVEVYAFADCFGAYEDFERAGRVVEGFCDFALAGFCGCGVHHADGFFWYLIFDEILFNSSELFYSTGKIDYLAAVGLFFIDADDGIADKEHFW